MKKMEKDLHASTSSGSDKLSKSLPKPLEKTKIMKSCVYMTMTDSLADTEERQPKHVEQLLTKKENLLQQKEKLLENEKKLLEKREKRLKEKEAKTESDRYVMVKMTPPTAPLMPYDDNKSTTVRDTIVSFRKDHREVRPSKVDLAAGNRPKFHTEHKPSKFDHTADRPKQVHTDHKPAKKFDLVENRLPFKVTHKHIEHKRHHGKQHLEHHRIPEKSKPAPHFGGGSRIILHHDDDDTESKLSDYERHPGGTPLAKPRFHHMVGESDSTISRTR